MKVLQIYLNIYHLSSFYDLVGNLGIDANFHDDFNQTWLGQNFEGVQAESGGENIFL